MSADIIRFPIADTAPSECDPCEFDESYVNSVLFGGRPPRSKPHLVMPRRIITDDDMHGEGNDGLH